MSEKRKTPDEELEPVQESTPASHGHAEPEPTSNQLAADDDPDEVVDTITDEDVEPVTDEDVADDVPGDMDDSDSTDEPGLADETWSEIGPVVEALVFAAEDALAEKQIVSIVRDTVGADITPAQIARAVESLNASYESAGRAFRIHVWGGGYRMATTPEFAPFVKTLYYQQKVTKLSRSLLETLAILAYKQPATKPELDYVRGVDCDHALRRLLEMGLVEIAGRADTVGRPLLYQTTPEFMDKFGLSSIDDLPTLREIEELMEDPTYSKEHARLLFREGLGLDGEPDADADTAAVADGSDATDVTDVTDVLDVSSTEASAVDETPGMLADREANTSSIESRPSSEGSADESRVTRIDIEGDGAVGSTDGYVLGGGPDPTQSE